MTQHFETHFSAHLWPAETLLKTDFVVALYQTDAECRWDKILGRTLHTLDHIFPVNDSLYMLRNGRIRPFRTINI